MATITENSLLKRISFKEASSKLNDPLQCFVLKKFELHVALSPKCIGNVTEGVTQQLNQQILLYSEEHCGVPIAFKLIKLNNGEGWLMDDKPEIHLDVRVNSILFSPQVGSRLVGAVNKIGQSFVGCLVHGAFNGTVWVNKQQEKEIDIGCEVELQVTNIRIDKKVLSVEGRLIKILSASYIDTLLNNDASLPISTNITVSSAVTDSSDNSSSKKKKKKRKHSETNEASHDVILNESVVLNGVDNSSKTKKKRKHSEMDDTSCNVTLNGSTVVDDVDSSSKKKKKKRKHNSEDA